MTYIPNTTSSANVNISGGSIDGVPLGATTPASLTVKSLTNTGSEIDAVRVITSGAIVTQLATDHILIIAKPNGSATTVNLLSSPATGLRLIVKDGVGDAASNPIKLVPATTIDGSASISISQAYGSVEICYIGTAWTIISTIGTTSGQVISLPATTESTEGTIVTASAVNIYASQLPGTAAPVAGPFDTYALTANPGQILINGAADPVTSNVTELVYHQNSVYQQITSGSWFSRAFVTTTSSNLVHNSTNVGAALGSGRLTLPTTWGADLNGLVLTVNGLGTDTSTGSSIPYIDMVLAGTTTGTGGDILFDGNIPVSPSTQYTLTAYVQLKSGSLTNITFPSLLWNENNASNGYVTTLSTGFTPTGTLAQYTLIGTTSATTASLQPQMNMSMNASSAVNATFRIAGIQLVQGGTATTFHPTPASNLAWVGASSPLPATPTLNIGVQANQPVGSAFTVSGTLGGYSTAPVLNYQDNQTGAWLALPSPVVSTTTWSFLHPSVGTASNLTVGVRDTGNTAINALSNSFQIYTPGAVTITDITLSGTTFVGASPGGTAIGTVSVVVTGGTFSGTLGLGGANAASFNLSGATLQVGSSSPAAGTYSISITATMASAAGSPFTKTFSITGTATGTGTAPSQASAAGFNTLIFFDDFTSNNISGLTGGVAPYKWYNQNNASITVNTTQLASQVSNGNSGGGSNASANGGILRITSSTASAGNLASAAPGSENSTATVQVAGSYQHFYAEAYMQFPQAWSGTQWPGFWGYPVGGNIGGGTTEHSEIDFMEYQGQNAYATVWQWHANKTSQNIGQGLIPGDSNWHTYGALWQLTGGTANTSSATGRWTFYVDNVARASVVNTGSGTTYTSVEVNFLYLALNGPSNQVAYIDWVKIWR